MAQFGKDLARSHRWTPPWWGNDVLPADEQFWLEVLPLSVGDVQELSKMREAMASAGVDENVEFIARHVLSVHNLRDESGSEIADPVVVLRAATPAMLTQLAGLVRNGLTEPEGKD